MKKAVIVSIGLTISGVLVLVHQRFYAWPEWFQWGQVEHHETVALVLWALAIGVLFGAKGKR